MKIIQSASIPFSNEKVKIVPVKGQVGLYSVENAYSGVYQFFREPLVVASTPKEESPQRIPDLPA